MEFRLILHEHRNAYENMAIDEAILKKGVPTLRFYKWDPSAISIGYFQSILEEVNLEECKKNGIDVVRRITGGGAVYHDREGEITYSFVCSEKLFPNILESYRIICRCLAKGLHHIGLNAEHTGINDIVVNGRKISGSAQTRRYGNILQHGTILKKVNVKKMFSLLKVSKEKISDKKIKSVEDRVTSIEREGIEANDNEIIEGIVKGFKEVMNIEFYKADLSKEEIKIAESLRRKYESKEWNFKR